MRMIKTTHARLASVEQGPADGPAVVFINSLGTDVRVWDALLPYLPAGWRIIRYDKRGHGLSDCPPGPYRMAELADDLVDLLDRLAVNRMALVGLSIGGMIAQAVAARAPDRVRGLILCDTAARIGTEALWADRIAAVQAGGIAAIESQILSRWFSPTYHQSYPDRVALWRHMLTRQPVEGYLGCCAALKDADLTMTTAALAVPALGLVGADDGSTPPETVRATLALIANSRFHVIDQAGHLPGVEQPKTVADLIVPFINGLPA